MGRFDFPNRKEYSPEVFHRKKERAGVVSQSSFSPLLVVKGTSPIYPRNRGITSSPISLICCRVASWDIPGHCIRNIR